MLLLVVMIQKGEYIEIVIDVIAQLKISNEVVTDDEHAMTR